MPPDSPLTLCVNVLAVGTWVLLLFLLAAASVNLAVRKPIEFLLATAVAACALAIRLYFSPRLPMIGAHGDFTHFRDISVWLRDGLGKFMGVSYPAGYRLLFWGLAKVASPSVEVAFWATTLLGSFTASAAYVLVRHLTGRKAAGVFAGLALACYPPAVYFCNGLNLETGAAFLLTANVAAFASFLGKPAALSAGIHAATLVLFCQTRGEGLGVAALLLGLQALWAWETGRLRAIWSHAAFPLLAGLLLAPYVWNVLSLSNRDNMSGFATRLLVAGGWVFPGALLAIGALRWLRSVPLMRWAWFGLLMWASAEIVVFAQELAGPVEWWRSVPKEAGPSSFLVYYGLSPTATSHFYLSPGLVPLYWLFLGAAALMPAGKGRRGQLSFGAALLLAVPVAADYLLNRLMTGNLIAESIRYHVPYSGLVAAAVGMGAWRFGVWLAGWRTWPLLRVASPLLAALLSLAALLAPLFTHEEFMGDVEHNVQSEYRFVRQQVERFGAKTLVVLPDFPVTTREYDGPPARIIDWFRTDHLFYGLGSTQDKIVEVAGLSRDKDKLYHRRSPTLVYTGQDCYRVHPPALRHPWCEIVADLPGARLLASQRVPNRRYSGAGYGEIGPSVPMMELSLWELTPEAMKALVGFVISSEAGHVPDPVRP